jgi:predicted Zn finger-like uncharacterized protein
MKSSVTTCPHCTTQFVVDDAQLSQYGGKVRCGHCLNVFNAVDYITPSVAESAPEVESITPAPVQAETVETKPIVEEVVIPEPQPVVEQTPVPEEEPVAPQTNFLEESSIESDVSDEMAADVEEEVDQAFIDKTQSLIENINIHDIESELEPEVAKESVIDSSAAQAPAEPVNEYADYDLPQEPNFADSEVVTTIGETNDGPETDYAFLAEKKTSSPWLKFLALLFILVLAGQLIYFMRHTIAQQFPSTKPMLESICKPLGCEINLPKEIQLFSIDDSGIQEDSETQGVIRLTSTITNRANFNQAYPNLEVTLTDGKDVPKIRRTFKPEEYLAKDEFSEEGLSAGDSISVDMPLMADDVKVAGFRILLTY